MGVRLRDLLYQRTLLEGPVRSALQSRLNQAARDPQRLLMSLHAIALLLDTWPLASMVDEARERWEQGPDGRSLAVLARAAHIVSAVLGYPRVIDGRWPMPDVDWMQKMCGPGPHIVVSRAPADGSAGLLSVLNATRARVPMQLPKVARAQGDELVAQRAELLAMLRSGDVAAIRFETPVPWDDASRAALAELHDAAPAQRAFERYGHAGLLAPDAPSWSELLTPAPRGVMGEVLRKTCDVVTLPNLDARGHVELFAGLVWSAPHPPLNVVQSAGDLLKRLNGQSSIAKIAAEVGAPEDLARSLFEQLVELGAATAAE